MRTIWWIHPGKLTLYFMVPIFAFVVYVVPQAVPQSITLKGADYLDTANAAMGLFMVVLLGAFALVGGHVSVGNEVSHGHRISAWVLGVTCTLAMVAYVIWFFPVLLHGRGPIDRTEIQRTPGITSFTQLGVPCVLCYLHCVLTSEQRFAPIIKWQMGALIVFTVLRVFLWSERLAAIELFIPALLVVFTHARPRMPLLRRILRTVAVGGPYLGIPPYLSYSDSPNIFAHGKRMHIHRTDHLSNSFLRGS